MSKATRKIKPEKTVPTSLHWNTHASFSENILADNKPDLRKAVGRGQQE